MGSTPIPFRHLPVSRRKKKRPPKYDPLAQARRLARAVVGQVPPERVLLNKRKKKPKHKRRDVDRELEE